MMLVSLLPVKAVSDFLSPCMFTVEHKSVCSLWNIEVPQEPAEFQN